MAEFIDVPQIEPKIGLTIPEMIKLGLKVERASWVVYRFLSGRDDVPYEPTKSFRDTHFSYDFGGQLDDLSIYIARLDDQLLPFFGPDLAIKVVRQGMAIGYSGRTKRKANPDLGKLYEHARSCAFENEKSLCRQKREKKNLEIRAEERRFTESLDKARSMIS